MCRFSYIMKNVAFALRLNAAEIKILKEKQGKKSIYSTSVVTYNISTNKSFKETATTKKEGGDLFR